MRLYWTMLRIRSGAPVSRRVQATTLRIARQLDKIGTCGLFAKQGEHEDSGPKLTQLFTGNRFAAQSAEIRAGLAIGFIIFEPTLPRKGKCGKLLGFPQSKAQ